jgi:hypothetical protein
MFFDASQEAMISYGAKVLFIPKLTAIAFWRIKGTASSFKFFAKISALSWKRASLFISNLREFSLFQGGKKGNASQNANLPPISGEFHNLHSRVCQLILYLSCLLKPKTNELRVTYYLKTFKN